MQPPATPLASIDQLLATTPPATGRYGRNAETVCVLAISGVLGFLIGSVAFPTWQVAVETSQVVAGLVKYPPGNPFYMYHTKVWTVIHQIGALLLLSGFSEIVLSKLISGLLGVVSFQALSMLVYAISRDVLLALGTPFFVLLTRAADHGTIYPIALVHTDHTYGVLGLSAAVLVVALLGAGCYRLGGFLLGLVPALHAALGAWLLLIVTVAFLWDFNKLLREFRPGWKFFALGCAITGISLAVHLAFTVDVPRIDGATASRYVSAFVSGWDRHRSAAPLVSVGTIVNASALVLALVWLTAFARDVPPHALFALRAIAASASLSLAFMFVSWLPPEKVPEPLLVVMPARFLNFNTLAFVAFLLGLLGIYAQRKPAEPRTWGDGYAALFSQFVIAALVLGLFFSYRSMLWDVYRGSAWGLRELRINPWHVFVAASIGLIGSGGLSAWPWRRSSNASFSAAATGPVVGTFVVNRALRTLSLGIFALCAVLTWSQLAEPTAFRNWTNDPLFAAIAAEKNGVLLTGGSFHLVQLYTRRPVLLDGGALDAVPYAPESGPATERILRDVYGIDYFHPPAGITGGFIAHEVNKPIWESYSREKWQKIGRAYDATQVLTRADWTLDLPVAAETRSLKLFRIPK